MTQEKFDEYFAIANDNFCYDFLGDETFSNKIKEAVRTTIVLHLLKNNKEDMTNWHLYAEKYLLGMNEENKEIPKEE